MSVRRRVRHGGRLTSGPLIPTLLGLAMAGLLVLAGCRFLPSASPPEAAPAGSPQPTIMPSATASPTWTPSPTATPSPTPTPLPAERLTRALQLTHWGRYEDAVELLRGLVEDPGAAPWHADALYSLGQAALHAGRAEEAVQAFSDLLQSHPEYPHADHARAWLAKALENSGRYADAVAQLEKYLANHPETAGEIYRWIGDLYTALTEHPRAAEAYLHAAEHAPRLSLEVQYREARARALLAGGDLAGAIAEYDHILSLSRLAEYRAQILYQAGSAYLTAGETQKAIPYFRQAIQQSQRSRYAYLSLIELVNLGVEVDEFQRGMIDYYAGAYWPAIAAFQRYLAGRPASDADTAQYYLAASYAGVGETAQADQAYRTLLSKYPNSRWVGETWMRRAELAAQNGDLAGALELYARFARSFPKHPLAPQALFARAELLERAGRLKEAAEAYMDMARDYPAHASSAQAWHRAALCAYRLGDYAGAAESWETLIRNWPQNAQGREAQFWAGKSLAILGKLDQALPYLQAVAQADPLEYYGQRALALTRAVGQDASGPAHDPTAESDVWQWLSTWNSQADPPSALEKELEEAPAFQRARELWDIGMGEAANAEMDLIRQAYADQPAHLLQLALMFRDMGAHRQSILAAQRVITLSGRPLTSVPLL
ncbi:MAG: tetratricopeptide repeat protein, partial [Anaerolineae bacterium]